MKIGITGSLSSGKSSVAKILANKKNILFSADKVVQKIYSSKKFNMMIKKKFNLETNNIKNEIKNKLIKKEISLKELGRLIHPAVRKEMIFFSKKNKNKKILFFEIPLLIESKLTKFFDTIILVVAPKKIRLKRYIKNGGEKKMFNLLDKNQIPQTKKKHYSDYLIVNNDTKKTLKKRINAIIKDQ